jgi:hypothetical protein
VNACIAAEPGLILITGYEPVLNLHRQVQRTAVAPLAVQILVGRGNAGMVQGVTDRDRTGATVKAVTSMAMAQPQSITGCAVKVLPNAMYRSVVCTLL